jgi:protein-L-isoaspartate(D-aspartate) O-methyltransferase
MAAPSPPPEENDRAFSTGEPAVVWRAYARQMLAILGVDNPAIEAAYAAVPREAFLGPPPWTASSPFGGIRPLPGADPVILYQDLVIGLDPAHGVNNPPGAARQAHRGPRPEARRAHRPCRRRRGLL